MHRLIALAIVSSLLLGCTASTVSNTAQLQLADQVFTVWVADSELAWQTGLGEMDSLAADQGMLFIFPEPGERTFWMKDVEYPIDIIWINQHRVIGFITAQPEANSTPFSEYLQYPSPGSVDWVVELPAGTVASYQIQLGDQAILDESWAVQYTIQA